jgi:beta-lactamase class A
MDLNRRGLLAAGALAMASPALAVAGPSAFAAYERATGGRIGVFAENLDTGARLTWRADDRFVMCSTFKASLAALVLTRVDRGQDHLDRMITFTAADLAEYAPVAKDHLAAGALSVAEMCRAAVELSDNTCANLLLARVGGPPALTRFWRALGDTVTRLDHDEPVLNRTPPGEIWDTTSPAAMAGDFRRLIFGDGLSPASRERLTGWMVNCQTGADRLRAGLPKDWRIGDKTGNNGKDAFGDIAVAWTPAGQRLLICAYTRGGSPAPAQVDAAFAAIGRLAARRLAGLPDAPGSRDRLADGAADGSGDHRGGRAEDQQRGRHISERG